MKHIRNYHLRIERWKDVEEFEGLYQASTTGKAMNKRTGKILKPDNGKNGYQRVTLSKNGVTKRFLLHRLVAQTFIPNPDNLPEVDHINTNRSDNCVWNLQWVTREKQHNNPITKKHLSEANTGKQHTPQAKEKMRQARLGKSNIHSYKPIIQLLVNGEFIKVWDNIKSASVELGILQSAISNNLSGRSKSAGGYKWQYA